MKRELQDSAKFIKWIFKAVLLAERLVSAILGVSFSLEYNPSLTFISSSYLNELFLERVVSISFSPVWDNTSQK